MLLSLATATWQTHDAREQVYDLVGYLNKRCGSEFWFSKDFVLKTLLVCSEQDVRFRTENIRRKNQLEDIWERVRASLQLTVKLAAKFGFNGHTLTSTNALIPIAYYLYKRGFGETFLTSGQHESDREKIRVWLLKILLGKLFRYAADQLLTNIRTEIRAALEDRSCTEFPASDINVMLRSSRRFSFTAENIEVLVDETGYGTADSFAVLALLYPHLEYGYNQFHIDHIHPYSRFSRKRLSEEGMDENDIAMALERRNMMPNLQLLPGSVNEAKRNKPFDVWLDEQPDPHWHRTMSFIPNVDLDLGSFHQFYKARRKLLIEELKNKLGFVDSVEPLEDIEQEELEDEVMGGVIK